VVIACGRGCDRTGLVALLLLALVGVSAADIADDWALSVDRLRPREPDYQATLQAVLDREATTVPGTIAAALDRFDVAARLRDGGLTHAEIDAVRLRLVA
jgi:protein-tyrosine phosphatase